MVKTETKWHNKSGSGFTLLELLVVVGILAALVALALPFYQDYVNQSKLIFKPLKKHLPCMISSSLRLLPRTI